MCSVTETIYLFVASVQLTYLISVARKRKSSLGFQTRAITAVMCLTFKRIINNVFKPLMPQSFTYII